MDELIEKTRGDWQQKSWMYESRTNFKTAHNELTKEMASRRY
jgi:hypothetical protein